MNDLRMDLKVCEGCGTLWLRVSETKGVYCRACTVKLSAFPAPRRRRSGVRQTMLKRATGCAAAVSGGAR